MITESTTVARLEALLREAGVARVRVTLTSGGADVDTIDDDGDGLVCGGDSIATALDRALLRLRGGA